jgi:hypothetical protein
MFVVFVRFFVCIDNATVHSEPLTAFQQGKIVNKPLMIGSNLNDGVLFAFAIAGGNKGTLIAVEYIGIVAGIFQDDWILDILLRCINVSINQCSPYVGCD